MPKLYYIVSLHQTTTTRIPRARRAGCIISFLYIKPQPTAVSYQVVRCCIISFLYIKPQLDERDSWLAVSCIISFLYIKPQPPRYWMSQKFVVLYRFSTSNHNCHSTLTTWQAVVLYRFSTSNHNAFLNSSSAVCVVLYRFSTSNHNSILAASNKK